MTEKYIRGHFGDIQSHACVIEKRLDDSWLAPEELIRDNLYNLEMCQKHGCDYILIDDKYEIGGII